MHWMVIVGLFLLVVFLIGLVFVRPDRTTSNGLVQGPSLWDRFMSWPNKMEALDNVLAGRPADAPTNRGVKPPANPAPPSPHWEPMEQENEWLTEVGIPPQYRARPPQWVSVHHPSQAELQMIAQMNEQQQLAYQAMMNQTGQIMGYSIGAHVSPRPAGPHPVGQRTAEYDTKIMKKRDEEKQTPQSIDRFDKLEE